MTEGKLIVTKNKTLQVNFINPKGKEVSFNVKESELSSPLLKTKKSAIAQLNGIEVEFEVAGGQPTQIREKGKTFDSLQSAKSRQDDTSSTTNIPGDFHNPYNFVPALPRNTDKIQNGELGDRTPYGHGSYQDDLWSGKISVTLTVATPLLIPDAANATGNEHKIYPIRTDIDGKPYLPPTSIKGMLRSAYEAVTNSRLSVFEKHEDRLAYRMPANIGLQMVPARIENGKIYLYPGTSSIGNDGRPQGAMYAAWLPRYNSRDTRISPFAVKYQGGQLPQHGQAVTAWLEKYEKTNRQGNPIFTYWRVRKIAPAGQNLGNEPNRVQGHGTHQPTDDEMIKVDGYVCVTNKNIDKKHDERLFFCHQQKAIEIELTPDLQKKWKELITNYQKIHRDEIAKGMERPPALNNSEWSRHIIGKDIEWNLSNRTLCYAFVKRNGNDYNVIDLYPVMISRGLYDVNPESLLDESLKPARKREDLSPADRVFGWVNQNGEGSYKGQLRISSVKCDSNNAIEDFEHGLPLAILGEPQPEQTRFYVAETPNGEPLRTDTRKAEGYQNGQGLRGRKVYPHHQLPDGYWDANLTESPIDNHFPEYLRLEKIQDNQNRTIKAWVKPETKFSFEIDVINLSSVELGALLWLLQLPENNFYRLGGGKPLGFGSVQLNIEDTDLQTGKQWQEFYSTLIANNKPEQTVAINSSQEFQKAVEAAYAKAFEQVSFIAAFLQAAKGFDKPIHYPRTTKAPKQDGESFKWFVENEKLAQPHSLDYIVGEQGLPILESK
ncbi:MAG: TIGR03986 family CRISPR-associated RAMP protein [Cyanomargarita calcarea GSE-NOS-MK-12-04C]|jgi:CRISPR-associated protein (TIGR03986 family)|uniref:TIGR03986 family CRISPR-associated RAMP protein n=1 Tax=Cyanomargarita calcarea GSE-NOS-MK-12-04C TaxID=2839659 RepID=A0A951QW64_9CYAN|nr:TIGR03986 family CRISPR-associated RAMP protein [Cyanomargarita calcarea GSE-NOS-MK-12-04C]